MPARGTWQPVYQRIADEIRAQVMTGALQPGAQIATEHELAAKYEVARATVRQGLMLLVQEGLIFARRPLGYFVRRVDKIDLSVFNFERDGAADAWVEEITAQGRVPRQEIRVEILQAEESISARLKVNPDSLVVVRRRLRFVDDVPYVIADSYYPEEIVRGTAVAHPADVQAGVRHVLAELGHKWVVHEDEVEGRHPTDQESRQLMIPPGLAVLVHTRTSSNAQGVPSRVMVSVFPVDRWRLLYRIEG
jgi:DNA-binding GntR family transcriptional regulator